MEIQGATVKDFHDLKVWQKAHQLTLAVYQITAAFPREELYGLTSQLRRCSSSIPANLAEGCGRKWRCRIRQVLLHRHGISE
jgi:four helix bundle protein